MELPLRQNSNTVKIYRQNLSLLETLLQMGFPRSRAIKALTSTGNTSAYAASDWILAHVNDPNIDVISPRKFAFCLCPVGELAVHINKFMEMSLCHFGWNIAHNYIPHILLTPVFDYGVEDGVESLVNMIEKISAKYAVDIWCAMRLEKYISNSLISFNTSNSCNKVLNLIKSDIMDLLPQSYFEGNSNYRLNIACQFPLCYFDELKCLFSDLDPDLPCTWEFRLYSYETRFVNHQVFKVVKAHVPRVHDELELKPGNFIFVLNGEMQNSPDGWVLGTSWNTGCQGYVPCNFLTLSSEMNTWTLHYSSSCDGFGHDGKNSGTRSPLSIVGGSSRNIRKESRVGPARKIFIVRHAERVDYAFGDWINRFFDTNKYIPLDRNMPGSVPTRSGGSRAFALDCPITRVGSLQARLVGESLKELGYNITHVYSSPALRCVQTCHEILNGLGLSEKRSIHIEPGLFEWLAWYQDAKPDWMTPIELHNAGYNVKVDYVPFIAASEMLESTPEETCQQLYCRNFFVTQCILQGTESVDGNLLFVGHAATLDTCSRQLVGGQPRAWSDMMNIVRKVPFCCTAMLGENSTFRNSWKMMESPIPPMTHLATAPFDWKLLLD